MKKIIVLAVGLFFAPTLALAAPLVTIDTPTISVCGAQDVLISGTARFEYGASDTDYLHVPLVGPGPDVELLTEVHTGDGTIETVSWSVTHNFSAGSKNVQVYIYDDISHTINEASTFVVFEIEECDPPPPDPEEEEDIEEETPAPTPAASAPPSGGGGIGISFYMECDELPAQYPKEWPYCLPPPVIDPVDTLIDVIGRLQVAVNKQPSDLKEIVELLGELVTALENLK